MWKRSIPSSFQPTLKYHFWYFAYFLSTLSLQWPHYNSIKDHMVRFCEVSKTLLSRLDDLLSRFDTNAIVGTVFRQESQEPPAIGDVSLLLCYEKYLAEVKGIYGGRPPSLSYDDIPALNCVLTLNSSFGRIVKGVPGDGMEVCGSVFGLVYFPLSL